MKVGDVFIRYYETSQRPPPIRRERWDAYSNSGWRLEAKAWRKHLDHHRWKRCFPDVPRTKKVMQGYWTEPTDADQPDDDPPPAPPRPYRRLERVNQRCPVRELPLESVPSELLSQAVVLMEP